MSQKCYFEAFFIVYPTCLQLYEIYFLIPEKRDVEFEEIWLAKNLQTDGHECMNTVIYELLLTLELKECIIQLSKLRNYR